MTCRSFALLILLPILPFSPTTFSQEASNASFEMNGIRLGDTSADILGTLPGMACEASCLKEDAVYLGARGRFVIFLRDGRASLLAMALPTTMSDSERSRLRGVLQSRYGQSTSDLGIEGCEEWAMDDGFLAVCLNKEFNHIVFSRESRVDVNKRGSNQPSALPTR